MTISADTHVLVDALHQRLLTLFVGADLPREITGLPPRADLARELARRHAIDETLPLADVAQRVSQAGGRFEFTDFLRRALDNRGQPPAPFYQRLGALVQTQRIETLITTAYDTLLADVLQQSGRGYNGVVRGDDLSFVNRDRPTLIWLYGKLDQVGSLVVTDRDHSDLLRDREREAVVEEVRRALRQTTVLFLGHNLADPDFRFLFDQVAGSRFARLAYAVWPGLPAVDVRMWRDRGIVILDVDPFGLLGPAAAPGSATSSGEPSETSTTSSSGTITGGSMDYPRGLQALRACIGAGDIEALSELSTLESRLVENQRKERIFGGNETTRSEHAQVIYALNAMALQHCGLSFNELSQASKPQPPDRPAAGTTPAAPSPTPPTGQTPTTPTLPPPPPEPGWLVFKLQLARQAGLEFETRAVETPIGELVATGRLPFDSSDLIAVLKLLEKAGYTPADFAPSQTEALQRLGLVQGDRLVPDYLERIGKGLYGALFPGDVSVAFRMAFNQARQTRSTVFLQLRFDHDAVDLARYPWELLHDGQRHLVSAGAVEMTRYITYAEAKPSLPVAPPAKLLFIESRPSGVAALPPDTERLAVWNALQSLSSPDRLIPKQLKPPTYNALLDCMAHTAYHLIHFDGHGVFARRCPHCGAVNYPHLTTCHSCQVTLADVPAQGYLVFQDSAGAADFVSTEDMENLLLNSPVRLMFLSACQSGVVRGESLFGGLGPGLIRAGVPAVVAMQFSVPVKAAIDFVGSFYGALGRGETVSRAVAHGRRRLFRGKTWFIPTLYLRSQDDEGHIFTI